ncbi:cysteine-rich receptor-like protein kinase 3 [Coffea arabica]|uniref:Cysteine-rich receptor-like protein kinase 3 n=1 Tax=Coffea arabica TaxID=13443 RepID=A0A6P6URE4_COFAR|nr:cysteine-rich receptor-like protein kinase 3 [Coffea arabica]
MSLTSFSGSLHLNHLVLFMLFFLLALVQLIESSPRAYEEALICGNKTASTNDYPAFKQNYISAIDSIVDPLVSTGVVDIVAGNGNSSTVFLFGACMKDLSPGECDSCSSGMLVKIEQCQAIETGTRAGRLYLGGCFIRFDDHKFENEITGPEDLVNCGQQVEPHSSFIGVVDQLLSSLSGEAPGNGGFYLVSKQENGVSAYGLAQCWKYLNIDQCRTCLSDSAIPKAKTCLPKAEATILNAGCYLKYSTQQFYNKASEGFRHSLTGGLLYSSLVFTLAILSRVAAN